MEEKQEPQQIERSRPEVSIIIPVMQEVTRLLGCLTSIHEVSGHVSHEVIVVANGTPPEQLEGLRQSAARVVPLSFNVGFAAGCNIGARAARGELLIFLNDDTIVKAGWLENLVSRSRSSDDIGAVGSRLLNEDGTLQEAGGVVWRSGRTDRVSGSPPTDLVEETRDVDYASACGLLVRRKAFWRAGGFDEAYFPAYYEDVDLSFSLRAVGSRVVYEPRAAIVHQGSVSSKQGYREFAAERSRRRFVDKWRSELDQRDDMPGQDRLAAAVADAAHRPPQPRRGAISADVEPETTQLNDCELSRRSVAGLEQQAALQASYIDQLETELANYRFEQQRLTYLRDVLRRVPLVHAAGRWLGRRVRANQQNS